MTWEDKVEMARLFNNGQPEEAISFFGSREVWDPQAIDMFVTSIDLSKCELCFPIDDRIQNIDTSSLNCFRSQLRLAILKHGLTNFKVGNKNQIFHSLDQLLTTVLMITKKKLQPH